jgi:hypothetical protein
MSSPLNLGDLEEGCRFHNAGVADRHVKRFDRGQRGIEGGAVGDVDLVVRALAHRSDRFDARLGLRLGESVDHGHLSASARELEGHGVTEVARGPGDRDAETVQLG